MNCNNSLAFAFLLLVASASAIPSSYGIGSSGISIFTLNGKSYLNGEYEVVTKDNAIRITNGKLQDILQMRKLTEDEQRTIKKAKENIDEQMADTMSVQREIQQQVNDNMQKTFSGLYDNNIPMGYNGFYNPFRQLQWI